MRAQARNAGFTLVEVMLALAILAIALVMLVKSVAGNISSAGDAFYMGIATDLARGKMYDIEEQILQDGFVDTDQELDGTFADEGWPTITWKATVVPTELPSFDALMGLQQGSEAGGTGSGSGSGSGSGAESSQANRFENSALGSMAGMFGGGGGTESGGEGADGASTGAFMQGYYTMIQQILKASIRKITVSVAYHTGIRGGQFDVVLYVVDTAGMAKSLGPMWKQ